MQGVRLAHTGARLLAVCVEASTSAASRAEEARVTPRSVRAPRSPARGQAPRLGGAALRILSSFVEMSVEAPAWCAPFLAGNEYVHDRPVWQPVFHVLPCDGPSAAASECYSILCCF